MNLLKNLRKFMGINMIIQKFVMLTIALKFVLFVLITESLIKNQNNIKLIRIGYDDYDKISIILGGFI